MEKSKSTIILIFLLQIVVLLSLFTCVYSRALGSHRNGWKPGHKKHKYITDLPWDPVLKKREQLHLLVNKSDECCPSVTEIIQPLGGVSKAGRILELYRDQNSTQSFYQTSCKEGVKGHHCRYIDDDRRHHSVCVQRYTYTYALVREFNSQAPWRLDYIRIRSGCSCEIRVHEEHFHGKKRKLLEEVM
ncbi:uncharacterized protein LOC118196187 [Stegodyphus dumicola]|uniref:uncharacterized protein LOC118196187 n=1 Tax=Stegodyphus dumicola TaxID=202533 RepID=UPI0015AD813F|nr:uncharacterized protein LOC118196187 [Stegodyphus dumicola]